MVGGGIRGGRVVGRTDAEGAVVQERPVSAIDFMATVCRVLGVDYNKMNQTPTGRPVRSPGRASSPPRAYWEHQRDTVSSRTPRMRAITLFRNVMYYQSRLPSKAARKTKLKILICLTPNVRCFISSRVTHRMAR